MQKKNLNPKPTTPEENTLLLNLKNNLEDLIEKKGLGLTQATLPANDLLFIINSFMESENYYLGD